MCLGRLAKFTVFLFNLLLLVAACGLVGLAIFYRIHNPGLKVDSVDTCAIIAGVSVTLIAFFGCCGVYKENTCLLTTYSSVLIALVVLQAALAVLAFLTIGGRNNLGPDITRHLKDMYDDKEENQEYMDMLDGMQKYFECCGIAGSNDLYARLRNGNLMKSCCEPKFVDTCSPQTAYKNGCQQKIKAFLEENFKIIGGIAVVIGIAEVVAAIIAICVKRDIRSQQIYA